MRAASREGQRPNWGELEVQVSISPFLLNKRKEEKECDATEEFRQGRGIMKLWTRPRWPDACRERIASTGSR